MAYSCVSVPPAPEPLLDAGITCPLSHGVHCNPPAGCCTSCSHLDQIVGVIGTELSQQGAVLLAGGPHLLPAQAQYEMGQVTLTTLGTSQRAHPSLLALHMLPDACAAISCQELPELACSQSAQEGP
jgi:hypothetical protein